MTGRLVIAVCETFKPELEAAVASGPAGDTLATTFGCRCGRGSLRWEDLPSDDELGVGSELHVFGAACLFGLKRDAGARPRVHLHQLGLCHELIAPRSVAESLLARGAYLVTPPWLKEWERKLEALGVVGDFGRRMFVETCRTVALVDTGVHEPATAELAEFARAVSLPSELVSVGNDVLEQRVEALVLARDAAIARAEASGALSRAQQQAADLAMALDVFGELAGAHAESEVVEGLFALFSMLMAPASMTFAPIVGGLRGPLVWSPAAPSIVDDLRAPQGAYALFDGGFTVSIASAGVPAGVLRLSGLAHPEHRDRYVAFALNVVPVCGMAIEKARQHEQLLSAERALSAEKERLAITLRSIGDGVVATDAAGVVVLMNDVAEQLTGWSQHDAIGTPWQQILKIVCGENGRVEDDLIERVLVTGRSSELARGARLQHRDGSWRVIADSVAPIRDAGMNVSGAVLVFRDITHAERIERELQRTEKLESLGVFAGGLAHDFNNLLGAMLGNVAYARQHVDSGSAAAECLDDVILAGVRARGLTQQLMTFARGGIPVRQTMSVEDVVRDSATLPLSGTNVRLDVDAEAGLWPVDADAGQLGQVIQNLVINAAQAMPRGGVVRIECRNVDPHDAATFQPLPGRSVRLTVTDQGPGISAENLARVFDPFFTTKSSGNGLGLAVVHSIVRRHGGYIDVLSEPGQGAVFRVYLPASEHEPAPVAIEPTVSLAGTGRILIMDDDVLMCRATRRGLERLGYVVTSVTDGDHAIAEYQAARDAGSSFDLVILDVTVPGGKGGLETMQELLAIDPSVRALVCTGYADAPVLADCARFGFAGALAKPYLHAELSRLVASLLRARSVAPMED
jgi:PAS domain S-box-containing protein